MTQKLIIIDGYSLANRAFFALPPLTTASGQPTNAAYGMATMLLKLLEESKPDLMVVAFDTSVPTFRHEEYAAYKGQRPKMEDSFKSQFPLIRRLLDTLRIPIYEAPGYEADDIIGTFAKKGAADGLAVEIVTGDRDAFQLVQPGITVLYTKKGITETDRVDPAYIRQRYNLDPAQLIDLKGLMGDASDNIPGIPGFGEKTALKYLYQFQTLEGIYDHLDEISRERERNLLVSYREQAFLSKRLATIAVNIPLEADLSQCCRHRDYDPQELLKLCREYEFKSLIKKFTGAEAPAVKGPKGEIAFDSPGSDPENLEQIRREIEQERECFLQLVTSAAGWSGVKILGIGIASGQSKYFWGPEGNEAVPETLRRILEDGAIRKNGFDLKKQMQIGAVSSINMNGWGEDFQIAGYLLNPGGSGLELEDLAESYLEGTIPVWRNERGTKISSYELPAALSAAELSRIAGGRLEALRLLKPKILQMLEESGLTYLYREVELPLIGVLFAMEQNGIRVDPDPLRQFGRELKQRQGELEADIYLLAGQEFNISSPKQLGNILFDKLGLPTPKKTKTGYSTDAGALEALNGAHPMIPLILEYRQNIKLQTTYIDALIALIHPVTGRVHTTFNQAVTSTGRLSSTEPNLQNIPIRTEEGRLIRRAFKPENEEYRLLAADYSQIELRVMAHFSRDPAFCEAFLKGEDIHRFTAASVLGIAPDQVSKQMRDRAKAVNFGIIYGISGFGLAKNIGVSRKEADAFIEAYFQKYPGVKSYVEKLIDGARETGEAKTLFGRIRKLPDLHSRNFTLRSFAERMARNTPIQGTAADIIKLAMVKIGCQLERRPELGILLLQVHDELVFEVRESRWRELASLVKQEMEGAVQLTVPLVVDVKLGETWGDMKEVTLNA